MSRVLSLVVVLSAVGCTEPAPAPEATSEVVPKHLMSELIYTQYDRLLKGLAEEPADSDAWDRCATHAALLSEAGDILMQPASDSDASWRIAATSLQDGGSATLAAIRARDLDGAREGFETLNESCASCHHECSAAYSLPWK